MNLHEEVPIHLLEEFDRQVVVRAPQLDLERVASVIDHSAAQRGSGGVGCGHLRFDIPLVQQPVGPLHALGRHLENLEHVVPGDELLPHFDELRGLRFELGAARLIKVSEHIVGVQQPKYVLLTDAQRSDSQLWPGNNNRMPLHRRHVRAGGQFVGELLSQLCRRCGEVCERRSGT